MKVGPTTVLVVCFVFNQAVLVALFHLLRVCSIPRGGGGSCLSAAWVYMCNILNLPGFCFC